MEPMKHSWTNTWWGTIALFAGACALVILFSFIYNVLYYIGRISSGDYTGFDESLLPPSIKQSLSKDGTITSVADIRATVESSDDPSVGDANAPVVIVEFLDFYCPYCKEAAPIVNQVIAEYGDQVRFIFRDTPVDYLHPLATVAAEASECADDQGKYLAYHNYFFNHQDELTDQSAILAAVDSLGLDMTAFTTCMDTEKYKKEVLADLAVAASLRVSGTPTFFINGVKVAGVLSFKQWQSLLAGKMNK